MLRYSMHDTYIELCYPLFGVLIYLPSVSPGVEN